MTTELEFGDQDFDRADDEVLALRDRLDQAEYVLRMKDGAFLITDRNGLPVHETDQTAYSQSLDDVRNWVATLCEDQPDE